jgi:putative spermidine/putrescine transport system ATP-binding protein
MAAVGGMSEVELVELTKTYAGGQTIGPVSLSVERGEMLSLLGPSGCGKTTVLRMIAGFVAPTSGMIRLRGADLTHTPPHRRGAALVFQNFALFPHLSVFDNIAFGPRRHGVARGELARRVDRLIGMMGLDGLTERRPAALSGGQQQRVALARALAVEPAVILLDEPFSSLDTKLRENTRTELRRLQQEIGFTAILVTHDQGEALSISDRIAIMNAGRLEQVGTAQLVYHRPATRFVADFIGKANRIDGGMLRPEAIRITGPAGSAGLAGSVISAVFFGAGSELLVRTDSGLELAVATDGDAASRYPAGSRISLSWPQEAVMTFGDDA